MTNDTATLRLGVFVCESRGATLRTPEGRHQQMKWQMGQPRPSKPAWFNTYACSVGDILVQVATPTEPTYATGAPKDYWPEATVEARVVARRKGCKTLVLTWPLGTEDWQDHAAVELDRWLEEVSAETTAAERAVKRMKRSLKRLVKGGPVGR